jgi:hypothetical protein
MLRVITTSTEPSAQQPRRNYFSADADATRIGASTARAPAITRLDGCEAALPIARNFYGFFHHAL